jgi:hypothetical protein
MDIFFIEDGKLKLNINILAIPELKAVYDKYINDYEPPLLYIHFMTHPRSAYHNVQEGDKEQLIAEDVGGDFDLDDDLIDKALNKCRFLYYTAVTEYYEGQKNSMYVIGKVLKSLTESSITMGARDGNLAEIVRMQKEAGKTMESFLKLEKLWEEQTQQKLRGNAEVGEY